MISYHAGKVGAQRIFGMIFCALDFSKDIVMVYNIFYMGIYQDMPMERSDRGMNCKDAEKKIPYFLQDEMDGIILKEFVKHVDSCPECREELSIQFLVAEGLERLEKGNNFNLQEELLMKLEDAEHRINLNQILRRVLICLEVAVAFAIIISLWIVFRL